VIEREKKSEAEIMQFVKERGLDIAAIIIEPIQGEGGDNHFRGDGCKPPPDLRRE
jgi:L-lysine 6-transaminase